MYLGSFTNISSSMYVNSFTFDIFFEEFYWSLL